MKRFSVSVYTEDGDFTYSAIAKSSFDALDDAIDLFGVCAAFVRLL